MPIIESFLWVNILHICGSNNALTVSRYEQFLKHQFFESRMSSHLLQAGNERHLRSLELEQEMERAGMEPVWREQMKRILADKESHYLRRRRQRMRPDMFLHIKVSKKSSFVDESRLTASYRSHEWSSSL